MIDFGNHASNWMGEKSDRVIAVHCKGGKGRTGTMLCAWLLKSRAFQKPEEALNHFSARRTGTVGGDEVLL